MYKSEHESEFDKFDEKKCQFGAKATTYQIVTKVYSNTPSFNLHMTMGRDQQTAGQITNIGRWMNFVYAYVNSVWAKAL